MSTSFFGATLAKRMPKIFKTAIAAVLLGVLSPISNAQGLTVGSFTTSPVEFQVPQNFSGGSVVSASCPDETTCSLVLQDSSGSGSDIAQVSMGSSSFESLSTFGNYLLTSISCPRAESCVTVGQSVGDGRPTVMVQSSGAWGPGTVPPLPSGADQGILNSVSCISNMECLAVGEDQTLGVPLVEFDNKMGWANIGIGSFGDQGELSGVSCSSDGACTAVGEDLSTGEPISWNFNLLSGLGDSVTLLNLGSEGGALNAVSCISSSTCVAVGQSFGNSAPVSLLQTNDSWSPPTELSTGSTPLTGQLNAITCLTAANCIAVGQDWGSGGPLIAVSNGSAFQDQPEASGSTGPGSLYSVSCGSSQKCLAAGQDQTTNNPYGDYLAGLGKATPVINFVNPPSQIVFGAITNLHISTNSTGLVSLISLTPAVCAADVSEIRLTAISAGNCIVKALVSESPEFIGGSTAPTLIHVVRAEQAPIEFHQDSLVASVGHSIPLATAGGSSGLPVAFTTISNGCSISGEMLTSTQAGTCVVVATEPGGANYLDASATQDFIFTPPAPAAPVISNSIRSGLVKSLIGLQEAGAPAKDVSWSVTGTGCSIAGRHHTAVSDLRIGSCVVTATDTVTGLSSDPATFTFTGIAQAPVTVYVNSPLALNQPIDLVAFGGSGGGAFSFALVPGSVNSASCSLSGAKLIATTAGECAVEATRGAHARYAPVVSAPLTLQFSPTA